MAISKSHKLLPSNTVFPGKNWGFSALTSGPLMSSHRAAKHVTRRGSTSCVEGWQSVAVFSIDSLEHRLKKHPCFGVFRSGVVRLPPAPAWKSQGFCLADVAGVLQKSQPSARQVGSVHVRCRWVHGLPSRRLQNTQVSERAHLPRGAHSKL